MNIYDLKQECKSLRYEAMRAYFDGDTKRAKELNNKASDVARKVDQLIGEKHESS